jgi:hypothetical protein
MLPLVRLWACTVERNTLPGAAPKMSDTSMMPEDSQLPTWLGLLSIWP